MMGIHVPIVQVIIHTKCMKNSTNAPCNFCEARFGSLWDLKMHSPLEHLACTFCVPNYSQGSLKKLVTHLTYDHETTIKPGGNYSNEKVFHQRALTMGADAVSLGCFWLGRERAGKIYIYIELLIRPIIHRILR